MADRNPPRSDGHGGPKKPKKYGKFWHNFPDGQPDLRIFWLNEDRKLEDIEKCYASWVLRRCDHDIALAAEKLGISVRTLYNWFGGHPREEAG